MSSPATARATIEKKASSAASEIFERLPHEKIATLAYALWQQRGSPDGSAEIDWFEAEQKLLQSVESGNKT